MDASFGALSDLRRREADPIIDHVQPGIERPRRDLLGPVGVAVEARLANEELYPATELQRHALDLAAQRIEIGRLLARPWRNARRSAELAEFGAQGVAPFASRDARFGRLDRGRHDVGAACRRRAKRPKRLSDASMVTPGAPRLQGCDLLRLGLGGRNQYGALTGGQRRWFGIDEGVDADDDLFAALNRLQPAGVGFDQASLEDARLDHPDRAAHCVNRSNLAQRLAFERLDQGCDFLAAVENVAEVEKVRLVGHDLLQTKGPLLVKRPRQA